ncbi:hypothetical protein [Gloeobacter morelensis]|uniref:Prevent-host-death family protein n=1 Tax=Gloeobacter morelensis MG652769 TaxID=2781736 RepID=A0ABY3PQC1_9CYAN|nr:hypothetical protein [Gloeobacter morelensis]UFP95891.1 hypothetical protein ISF26_06625 [Gloeobacter morelensis MG652769]
MEFIGVREFRDRASHYLASKHALGIRRNNRLIGVYIPLPELLEHEEQTGDIERLGELVRQMAAQNELDEESFAAMFESAEDELGANAAGC